MNFFERVKTASMAFRSTLKNPDAWLINSFTGNNASNAGISVTPETALTYSAVFACVRLAREVMMMLPAYAFEKQPDGTRHPIDHDILELFNGRTNPEMPAQIFKETLQAHLELRGRGHAEIVFDRRGMPVELWPIHPDDIRIQRNDVTKKIEYLYLPSNTVIPYDRMFHLRGFSPNGVTSYSPISLARHGIGLGMAADEFGGRFFKDGTNIGGFIEHPKGLSDASFNRLKKEMSDKYKGLQKAHGVIILEEGMKYSPIGISMEDSQFLQSRTFQVREIARWFGMPPHLIGDLADATFSNIEHQGMEAVKYSFNPRAVRWEAEINTKLLLPKADKGIKTKFNMESLHRGDLKTRMESYNIAVQNGIYCRDEVRALEDRNPIPGGYGKIHTVQLNMVDLADLGAVNGADPDESRNYAPIKQKRSKSDYQIRAVSSRRKLADRYIKKIKSAAEKLVKAEVVLIRSAIEDLAGNPDQVVLWLKDDFSGFSEEIKSAMLPVIRSFGLDVFPVAAAEIGLDQEPDSSYEQFLDSYAETYANRHLSSSRGQLIGLLSEDEADLQLVEDRLSEWEEKRADKIGRNEATRGRNAFAKAVFAVGGIRYIRAVANGKSCPYCSELDGQVIGIDQYFLSKGQEFKPEGAESSLTSSSNISHPPFHAGCDCDIVAD